jgi:hypothetical protein
MAEKNEEYKGLTGDEAAKIILAKRHEVLDHFAKAYIAETGLMPSQIELCTQQVVNGTTIENIFFFRRRTT